MNNGGFHPWTGWFWARLGMLLMLLGAAPVGALEKVTPPLPPPPPVRVATSGPSLRVAGSNAIPPGMMLPGGGTGTVQRIPLAGERQSPVDIPDPWRRVWIGVLVAVVAALSAWAWWRWQRRPVITPMVEPPDPVAVARARIDAARVHLEDPRQYVAAVSDAVRRYLEDRFGLRAPEQTTEEFLEGLNRRPLLDVRHQGLLSGFLEQCDLVKFAGWRPGSDELGGLEAASIRFVDETAPTASAGPGPVGVVGSGTGGEGVR